MNRLSARSWRLLAAIGFWVLLAAAFITGGLAGLLLGYSAAIWLAIFSLGAWRRQDEFERAAQKFAWVFGGLFGLLASLALLPFILQPGILDPRQLLEPLAYRGRLRFIALQTLMPPLKGPLWDRKRSMESSSDRLNSATAVDHVAADVNAPMVAFRHRQSFVHQPQESVHTLQDALHLKHLDSVLQMRIVDLEEILAIRNRVEARETPVCL